MVRLLRRPRPRPRANLASQAAPAAAREKKVIPPEEWHRRLGEAKLSLQQMNALVMNFLVIEGHKDAAEAFAAESGTKRAPSLLRCYPHLLTQPLQPVSTSTRLPTACTSAPPCSRGKSRRPSRASTTSTPRCVLISPLLTASVVCMMFHLGISLHPMMSCRKTLMYLTPHRSVACYAHLLPLSHTCSDTGLAARARLPAPPPAAHRAHSRRRPPRRAAVRSR